MRAADQPRVSPCFPEACGIHIPRNSPLWGTQAGDFQCTHRGVQASPKSAGERFHHQKRRAVPLSSHRHDACPQPCVSSARRVEAMGSGLYSRNDKVCRRGSRRARGRGFPLGYYKRRGASGRASREVGASGCPSPYGHTRVGTWDRPLRRCSDSTGSCRAAA